MEKIKILCGRDSVAKAPLRPYDDLVCDFLDAWSRELRKDNEAVKYADLQTFAFWIRKSSVQKKKLDHESRNRGRILLGRGTVFHIAPSNVPVNCLYTYVFGLLAGNSNIVRVPSKPFPQVECACRVLQGLMESERFSVLAEKTCFVRYERDAEITAEFTSRCNSRVIWGGDRTISEVRKAVLPPRSNELTFADRYSIGILSLKALKEITTESLKSLAGAFYNDTYLMDQNACSSPHVILWMREKDMTDETAAKVQERFWDAVAETAAKYDLKDIKASGKYSLLCDSIMDLGCLSACQRYDNLLYVCTLEELPEELTGCRGKFGLFFQTQVSGWNWLEKMSDEKIQTCACYGMDQEQIRRQIVEKQVCGIDRIVPFGKTLDMDVIWDGYDIIEQLNRVIV